MKVMKISARQLSKLVREAAGDPGDTESLNAALRRVQASMKAADESLKRCKGFKNRRQDVGDIEYAGNRLRAALAQLNELRDDLVASYGGM